MQRSDEDTLFSESEQTDSATVGGYGAVLGMVVDAKINPLSWPDCSPCICTHPGGTDCA